MDHLERFEDLISAIIVEGVSEDYLICKLFKYSLSGHASHWLKQLPPGSLTSWGAIKNAFLCNFFDEARAEYLKRKIATFTQESAKSFKSSWIRFESYQRDCPHHGFNEVHLLITSYGINRILQSREDHDSREVRSKIPTSAMSCLRKHRSTF